MNTYDAPHSKCERDLVREFVEACNEEGIIPFFYHTLLDWYEKSYQTDFPKYLEYLRKSVEIICKNYGKIGGIWFDGMWDKLDADWEEDAFEFAPKVKSITWMDNGEDVEFEQEDGKITVTTVPFEYGRNLVVRVAKMICE